MDLETYECMCVNVTDKDISNSHCLTVSTVCGLESDNNNEKFLTNRDYNNSNNEEHRKSTSDRNDDNDITLEESDWNMIYICLSRMLRCPAKVIHVGSQGTNSVVRRSNLNSTKPSHKQLIGPRIGLYRV